MAFTAPTAAELKARFLTFEAENDTTVDLALSEAAAMVDDSWTSQADFTLGRMLYAAHVMTLEGFGTGAEAKQGKAGTFGFSVIKSGALTLERPADKASSPSDLTTTSFGRRFKELLARNRSGPLVANRP